MLIRNVLWEEYELGSTRRRLDISTTEAREDGVKMTVKGAA